MGRWPRLSAPMYFLTMFCPRRVFCGLPPRRSDRVSNVLAVDEEVLYGFVSKLAPEANVRFLGCSSPGAVSREHPYLRLLLSVVNCPMYFDEERQGRTTGVVRAIYNCSAIAPLAVQITTGALHFFQHPVHKRQVLIRPLPPVKNLQSPHDLTVGQGMFERLPV